ncbi:MAG TPA: thioredoxin family protein [Myxococcaceae bacterium]|nr:thioredoxin family protein [Myxococcaceae bacterium]
MLSALVTLTVLTAPAAAAPHPSAEQAASGIVFLEDDYRGALAKAKAEKKPLFLDSWATWCHSCLSMRSFVFLDAGLRPAKDAVVWLSVETEAEKNREVVEKFPADGLPTFLLIDPDTEQVIGRWLGTSSVNEMRHFVLDTTAAWQATRKGGKVPEAARAEQDGHAAQQRKDYAAAATAYRRSLALSAKSDPLRPERISLLLAALGRLRTPEAPEECLTLAGSELSRMPATPPGADVAVQAAGCAAKAGDTPQAKKLLSAALKRIDSLAGDTKAALSVDDRSDLYASLTDQLDELGRHDEAVAAMRKRSAMLEAAAAAAPDATTAATFDAHRTEAYLYLGEPAKAEALLTAREKQMPADYNPPARLARVLLEEKRAPEAEAAVDRALGLMPQGPRKVGILGLKARILEAEGKDRAPVLRERLGLSKTLPGTQRNPETEQKIEQELKALEAGPHAKR